MKSAPPNLIAWLLAKKPTVRCDLFTFSFLNGTVMRLTTFSANVTYQGNLFQSIGVPVLSRSTWEIKQTVEVPQMEVTLYSNGTDYESQNIKLMIHNGLFDGCYVLLQKLYMQPQTLIQLGAIDIFGGRTGPIALNASGAKITFKGDNVRLEQNFPRNTFQSGCIHTLYDAGCTLSRTSYTFSGTVATASAIALTWASDPTSGNAARLQNGYLVFTSGVANAERRTILTNNGNTGIQFIYPLYTIPAPGDTFTVTYGCQKTIANCNLFGNIEHYRGFPFVPPPETAF